MAINVITDNLNQKIKYFEWIIYLRCLLIVSHRQWESRKSISTTQRRIAFFKDTFFLAYAKFIWQPSRGNVMFEWNSNGWINKCTTKIIVTPAASKTWCFLIAILQFCIDELETNKLFIYLFASPFHFIYQPAICTAHQNLYLVNADALKPAFNSSSRLSVALFILLRFFQVSRQATLGNHRIHSKGWHYK